MSAGSSRYRVFSTHRFRNAPFSKLWASCTLVGSAALIPLHQFRQYFLLMLPNIVQGRELWKCATSKLFFLDAKDIVAGCVFIYCMRSLERRMGTKKYINFLILSTMTAISLEIILCSALNYYLPSIFQSPLLASGPYAVLYSCFVQFVTDLPFVSVATVYNIPLGEKTIPCILALLLFVSSTEARLACIAGLAAGMLYKKDTFRMSKWSFIPNWLAKHVDSFTEFFQNTGEDRRGRVLPLGATLEAQRQEAMDRFEQRMIYEQLRRQHIQDNQRGGGMFLNAARRFFGAPMPLQGDGVRAQVAVNVPEEKIRTLTDMGFNNRQRVVDVLRSTGNDLNAAAHILLQQEE